MKTRLQEPLQEAKRTVRNAFIVSGELTPQETDEWATLSWRDAGWISFGFATLGLVVFGLHFLIYGTGDGFLPRDQLVVGFSTVTAIFGAKMKTWKVRLRYLAGFASAMAIVGLFFRFVIHDSVSYSPSHLAGIVAILVVLWLGADGYERYKANRKAAGI